MIEVWLLAGFFAAHAVWSVEDGETLVPIYAYYKDGQRHMEHVEAERFEDAVRIGQEALAANTANATSAVLIYDGYLTFDGRSPTCWPRRGDCTSWARTLKPSFICLATN